MKWFQNPKTLEELKKQYKRLAMQHHPDIGGNVRDMQEINAEYNQNTTNNNTTADNINSLS